MWCLHCCFSLTLFLQWWICSPSPRRWKTSRCREHLSTVSGSCRWRSWQVRGRFVLFKQAPGFISTLPRAARITLFPQTQKHMFGYVRLWHRAREACHTLAFLQPLSMVTFHISNSQHGSAEYKRLCSCSGKPSMICLPLFSIKTGNRSDYGSALLISYSISFSLAGMELTCLRVCSSC